MKKHIFNVSGEWIATVKDNVEAMTSKGLRSDTLSTYTELDASYNAGLTTETFIGYSLC